jgi:uncharacterized damage-inducible protein DinB
MTRILDEIRAELATSREALLQEAARVSDDSFTASPDADTWSVSEILDHLVASERRVTGLFANAIAEIPRADNAGSSAQVFEMIRTIMAERAGGPLKSTHVPERGQSRDALFAKLNASRSALLAQIDAAEGLDLSAKALPHPMLGDLDLYQWLVFIARHEDRHRLQIARLRQSMLLQ